MLRWYFVKDVNDDQNFHFLIRLQMNLQNPIQGYFQKFQSLILGLLRIHQMTHRSQNNVRITKHQMPHKSFIMDNLQILNIKKMIQNGVG